MGDRPGGHLLGDRDRVVPLCVQRGQRIGDGLRGRLRRLAGQPREHSDRAGTVDSAATPDGSFLYVQTGAAGVVNGYRIESNGSLTAVGSVTVPGAAGGEGIVAL